MIPDDDANLTTFAEDWADRFAQAVRQVAQIANPHPPDLDHTFMVPGWLDRKTARPVTFAPEPLVVPQRRIELDD